MVLVLAFELNLKSVIQLEQHLILLISFLSNFCHQFQPLDQLLFALFFLELVFSFLVVFMLQLVFIVLEVFAQFDPKLFSVIF